MGRQLIDIKYHQAVPAKHLFDREQREIRKMLVIDCVELIVTDHLKQVRELQGYDASRLQHDPNALREGVQIRHVCVDIVARQQICGKTFAYQLGSGLLAEKDLARRDALLYGRLGYIARGLDSKHGYTR